MFVCGVAPAFATAPPTNTNEVAFWCGSADLGVKYDNLTSLTFTVPPPPEGFVWILLVLKAGSDVSVETGANETFVNPGVGVTYAHSSGKTLSHAILCFGPPTTQFTVPTTLATTTVATYPTTTAATTSTSTSTSSTTSTSTSTSTTSSSTTTTCPDCGTNPLTVPTTTIAPTTTAPPTTTPRW
jgi:hypothetical protein